MARILIVDDDKTVRRFVERILIEEGHEVFLASTGPSGLTEARHVSPDLILLDVMLPGMTGYEVETRLNQSHALRHIPVVYMTGLLHGLEAALLGSKLRGRPVITKPVRPNALRECVNAQLTRSLT